MQPEQPKQQQSNLPHSQQPPKYHAETMLVRRVAANADCWFRWTAHAEQRMAEYGHTADDVIAALINGQVIRVEVKEDVIFRVRGQNIDGEEIEIPVAVYERAVSIKVITVI